MSKSQIIVKKVASANRRQAYQSECLLGLGLKKIGQVRVLEDTPSVRGMVAKVSHLVHVIEK